MRAAEEQDVGLIQGSRYVKGGGIIGWGFTRKLQSRVANLSVKLLLGLPNEVTSCFRVYTRESAQLVVEEVHTLNYEFLVAATLAIKDHGFKIREVPVIFTDRVHGESKLKPTDAFKWLALILKMFLYRHLHREESRSFLKFCLVGALGFLVNTGLLWILTDGVGLYYVLSSAISIEASILFNFSLNDTWTFRNRKGLGNSILVRAIRYNLVCIAGALLNLRHPDADDRGLRGVLSHFQPRRHDGGSPVELHGKHQMGMAQNTVTKSDKVALSCYHLYLRALR